MKSHFLAAALLSVSVLALTGCDKEDDAVKSFKTVQECKAAVADDATPEEREKVNTDCDKAYQEAKAEHERVAPHYQTQGECVDLYGAENCGLSPQGYYYPSMNGFMMGYALGALTYQPYYYNRWGVTYYGTTNLGYYRGGYVYVPHGTATWTRSYTTVAVPRGSMTPPPAPRIARGGFGGSANPIITKPTVSAPSLGTRPAPAISTPSTSTRGGFGSTGSSIGSSSSG